MSIDTVVALRSKDGQLHTDPKRWVSCNLTHSLPKRDSLSNSKVLDFSECLAIIKHRALIEQMFQDLDAATSKMKEKVNNDDESFG